MKDKRRRNRKSPRKMKFMMDALQNDPEWTKDTCVKVAMQTGLSESQVYKWGWDQKNKIIRQKILNPSHNDDI